MCLALSIKRKHVHTPAAPVPCYVDKQSQMREMDNREQIDLPQALQWPAKLRGGPRRVCPVFVQPGNSKGLNMFHLCASSVLREPLESRHEHELKRKETGLRAGVGTSLNSPRAP